MSNLNKWHNHPKYHWLIIWEGPGIFAHVDIGTLFGHDFGQWGVYRGKIDNPGEYVHSGQEPSTREAREKALTAIKTWASHKIRDNQDEIESLREMHNAANATAAIPEEECEV